MSPDQLGADNPLFARMAAVAAEENPRLDELGEIVRLAKEQLRLEKEVAGIEKDLKEAQKNLKRVAEEELPALLRKLGLTDFGLEDGSRVEVGTVYHANISADRRPGAHAWLREHNFGDLIKNKVEIDVGRGQDEKVNTLVESLTDQGFDFDRKEEVHSSTLKAFVKEQIEKELVVNSGVTPLPRELFGVHQQNVAKIKASKKGK